MAKRLVACRKARPRALATFSDPFLPLAEARGQQIYRDRGFAARGPVEWRLDGSGRVWFAYANRVRPELAPAKFWSWNLAFKTPQPPALPEAADARDAPAAQIAR